MNKLSIGTKIGVGLSLILVMFIIVSYVSIQETKKIRENEAMVDHTNFVIVKVNSLLSDLKDSEIGQRGFIITGDNNYLKLYNSSSIKITKHITELKQLTSDNPNQQSRIVQMNALIKNKFAELEETISLRKNSGFEAARDIVISDIGRKVMDEIRVLYADMIEEEEILLEKRMKTSIDSTNNATNTVLWLTIGACIIVFLLIIFYVKNIAFPIKKLTKIALNISRGESSIMDEDTNRQDELGELIESFKLMQQYLHLKADQAKSISEGNLTIEVKAISEKDLMGVAFSEMIDNLRNQIEEISEGVNILSSSSSEISSTVSELSAVSAENASSVSETTTTIEEVKQTAEVSKDKATEVAESTQKISMISLEGKKSIEDTIDVMNKIKKQMESIAGIVIQLSEKGQTIGEITSTVNELSEQSNLLAVNASIEAAKAGEQGKGFMVVAQEIKNLAERSKESTIQIRTILADVQKEIGSAVMATEQGGKVINTGLKLSAIANEVISTLAAGVEQASQSNIQVAASSQQQQIGMDQISVAMENIREASFQTSASTKQTEKSIVELNNLGTKLMEMMKKYKLK